MLQMKIQELLSVLLFRLNFLKFSSFSSFSEKRLIAYSLHIIFRLRLSFVLCLQCFTSACGEKKLKKEKKKRHKSRIASLFKSVSHLCIWGVLFIYLPVFLCVCEYARGHEQTRMFCECKLNRVAYIFCLCS